MARMGRMASVAFVGALLACTDGTGTQADVARVTLQLTDAPGAPFASATVDIGAMQLIPVDGDRITITEDAGEFDLLDLQNGVTATLASLDVPAGRYLQLRLIVEGAHVTLEDGLTFADGSASRDLFVPSGAQSGIKVNLFGTDWTMGMADSGWNGLGGSPSEAGRTRAGRNGMGSDGLQRRTGVEIVPGETIIVLDFDVERNFQLTGPRDAPTGVLFRPLIRAVVRDIAGTIGGTVTDGVGAPVSGATVRASLVDSPVLEELQTVEATALTAEDGTYTIWFLAPGTYTVSVDGSTAEAQTVVVGEGQVVTGVNFQITS